ncbi:MAG: Gfo/Idh/MocA family oxidoreductase [Marinilabiliaceae bacterium]|nr:Gfo/Idh/MocA family oxidoreductase [Marinilabiliaceae bacterium]
MSKNKFNRRQFLSSTALIGAAAATTGTGAFLTSCTGQGNNKQKFTPLRQTGDLYIPILTDKAIDGQELKAGIVGCGGRGSGAAMDFLNAANNVKITALGDVFQDRIDALRQTLLEKMGVEIPESQCFTGFDAYQKVIDADVDVVIFATPSVFRPEQCRYAVEKGKHAFLEKPIAVDPTGYRSLMVTSRQADLKGLCILTGTQRHHQRSYVESYKKVQEGYIGDIVSGNVYWNQNQLWYKERQPGWSDVEWMIRDWVNWKWLSGDHIVEQHVHNIDVFNWFFGQKPISCVSFGSRWRRRTGDQYDNFSTDFLYENGVHLHSMCRQIDGCANNVSEFIQGTKGTWNSTDMTIRDLKGNIIWQFDFDAEKENYQQISPYVLEHVNWITAIRNKSPFNQIESDAISSLCGIMGRESAYTGSEITWEQIEASTQNFLPEILELGSHPAVNINISAPGMSE